MRWILPGIHARWGNYAFGTIHFIYNLICYTVRGYRTLTSPLLSGGFSNIRVSLSVPLLTPTYIERLFPRPYSVITVCLTTHSTLDAHYK